MDSEMDSSKLSNSLSDIQKRLENLRTRCISDPGNAKEILSDALEQLQVTFKELSAAGEELMHQNDEIILAQEASREIEECYRAFIALSSEGIWRLESEQPMPISMPEDDQIEFILEHAYFAECNDACARMYGLTNAEDLVGMRMTDLLPRSDSRNVEVIRAFIRSGYKLVDKETYEIDKEGNSHCITNSVTGIVENNCLVRVWGVQRDITERKRMEEELLKSKDELELRVLERTAELLRAKEVAEAALRAKSEFLAVISHELRTPLNGALGMASLLAMENLSSEQHECVDIIRSSSESLLVIINDILDFTRMESGKVCLEKRPFNLRESLNDALNLLSSKSKAKGLDIDYSIDRSAPETIMSDQTRLRQVLINLLDNAIKFTDKGRIDISISGCNLENNRQEIFFSVKDTGIGISQKNISKLFQPFSQVDMSNSRKYGGTGLGLAISRQLVELMGGKIWVESEVGKGSTFYFTIIADKFHDRSKDNLELTLQANMSVKGPMRSSRVLLAEDNDVNQVVTLRMLKKLGYAADVVASGREAIESLECQHYDIILMDVQMPDIDGLEATKEIRKRWPDNGPRIIALTAHALEEDRERCIGAAMDGYIAKPVKIEDLAEALEEYSQRAP